MKAVLLVTAFSAIGGLVLAVAGAVLRFPELQLLGVSIIVFAIFTLLLAKGGE